MVFIMFMALSMLNAATIMYYFLYMFYNILDNIRLVSSSCVYSSPSIL